MTASRLLTVIAVGLMCAVVAVAAELPVSRVVLFSNGVGYFEREGTVEGNSTLEMSFRLNQINDILKSLVLQDLSGGTIAPVTYAPQDPLERTLGSFEVDISDNPGIADLWDRLRGAQVQVVAERTHEGIVFGAEEQEKSAGDSVVTFQVLNLMTAKGLVSVPLIQVSSIKVLDAKLDADLRKALEAINTSRDGNKRAVVVSFKGKGKRTVRAGYLLETPVWKTSYRLVSGKDGMFLQGWAIVENTGDEDWTGVNLSLVSGRPVSFIQDLYQPLYLSRPVVPVSVAVAAAPRTFEGAMDREEEEEMAEEPMGVLASKPAAAPAPPMASLAMGYAAREAPAEDGRMDLGKGVTSMAAGGKVGTLFQYAITQPVTVARQRSAMIPIINGKIEGEKLSVYNAAANAKTPMTGILLKNTTDLHLMGGPITVFDGGVYGGDALIEDIAPKDERLITYAMDLAMEVNPASKPHPDEVLGARLVRGVMVVTRKSRTETTYQIKGAPDEPRTLLIEHPIRKEWNLVEPKEASEKTRSVYRFRVAVEAGKTASLKVVEEKPGFEAVKLLDRSADQVAVYLKMAQLSPAMKDALQKVIAMQGEIAALAATRAEKEARIKEIEQEQERIRKNMSELDRQSQLYRQYVEKFAVQEQEFDKLRGEVRSLREQEAAKHKALQDYTAGLSVE